MKLIFVLLFFTINGFAYGRHLNPGKGYGHHSHSVSRRILDGEVVSIEKAPFMALVAADKSFMTLYPFSSAVIISSRFLLSSATFFFIQRGKRMTAYLGEGDLKSFEGKNKYDVEDVFIHQMFNEKSFYYFNIALIKLLKEIKFNDLQRPISLLGDNDVYENFERMQLFSYGESKGAGDEKIYGVLRSQDVTINSSLLQNYGPITVHKMVKLCPGDSGAPLIMKNKLVALIIEDNGCKNDQFFVTGIYQFYNWIVDHVGEDNLSNAGQNAYPKKEKSDNLINFM